MNCPNLGVSGYLAWLIENYLSGRLLWQERGNERIHCGSVTQSSVFWLLLLIIIYNGVLSFLVPEYVD